MNKLTKVALAILTSLGISTASFAGELTVTGTAKATYSVLSSDSTSGKADAPKGIGIANEFSLSASGELDNGYTWSYAQDIDGATVQDDAKLTMSTPYGTVGVFVSEGGLSAKYGWNANAYAPGSDYGHTSGSTGGTQAAQTAGYTYGSNMSSYNNVQYHTPAGLLPYSTSVKIGYAPDANGAINSSNATGTNTQGVGSVQEILIATAPIDGLSLNLSYLEKKDQTNIKVGAGGSMQKYETGAISGKYVVLDTGLTVGLGYALLAPTVANRTAGSLGLQHYENDAVSLGYVVNPDLSVSFSQERSIAHNKLEQVATGDDQESDVTFTIQTVQAAYTMGGMTLSLAHKTLDNADYTSEKDLKETIFAVVMAF
jgi:hypothetical protein